MLMRVFVVAMNAYREAVRARLLLGLFGLALATGAYSLIVASLSLHQESRVVSDLGAMFASLFTAIAAIVVGATSLHREVEQKTIFPILARPLRRSEYIVGKYLGTLWVLVTFIAVDAALVLAILAIVSGQKPAIVAGAAVLLALILGALLLRAKYTRVFVLLPWAIAALLAMAMLASAAGDDRRLVLAAAALTLCEAAIITAVATFFSSFSSPFLTATFSFAVFVIGRSADTLAHLPKRDVGDFGHMGGVVLAHLCPNLHLYVPPRPVLLGQVSDMPIWSYVGTSALHAVAYSVTLLVLAWMFFRKRDFT